MAMALMRTDPFQSFERLTQQLRGGGQLPRPMPMPMTALRRGDQVLAYFDLPGVMPEDVDITVERNVVTIRAERRPPIQEGDEVLIDERGYGVFTRQVFLGDSLDLDKMTAGYDLGQLILTIPVSEQAKPRRIKISARDSGPQQIAGPAASEGEATRGAGATS
jgi:HSP20 family protein